MAIALVMLCLLLLYFPYINGVPSADTMRIQMLNKILQDQAESNLITGFSRYFQLSLMYLLNPHDSTLKLLMNEGKMMSVYLELYLNQSLGIIKAKHNKLLKANQQLVKIYEGLETLLESEEGTAAEQEAFKSINRSINSLLESLSEFIIDFLANEFRNLGFKTKFNSKGLLEKLDGLFGFLRKEIPILIEDEFKNHDTETNWILKMEL